MMEVSTQPLKNIRGFKILLPVWRFQYASRKLQSLAILVYPITLPLRSQWRNYFNYKPKGSQFLTILRIRGRCLDGERMLIRFHTFYAWKLYSRWKIFNVQSIPALSEAKNQIIKLKLCKSEKFLIMYINRMKTSSRSCCKRNVIGLNVIRTSKAWSNASWYKLITYASH